MADVVRWQLGRLCSRGSFFKVADYPNWRLIAGGVGIHWPDLDEDISVESLLAGRSSGKEMASDRQPHDPQIRSGDSEVFGRLCRGNTGLETCATNRIIGACLDMAAEYVEKREENYFVLGSRVSLDSVVYGFAGGESPETILDNFPTLSLEQVYGAIAFYLAHQTEIDAYLEAKKKAYEDARRSQTHIPSDLRRRIEETREHPTRPT